MKPSATVLIHKSTQATSPLLKYTWLIQIRQLHIIWSLHLSIHHCIHVVRSLLSKTSNLVNISSGSSINLMHLEWSGSCTYFNTHNRKITVKEPLLNLYFCPIPGNIFTGVCQSFCSEGEGVCLSACWDTPPGRYTPWQVPQGRYTPQQVHPLDRYTSPAGTPPGRYTPQEGTLPSRYTPGRHTPHPTTVTAADGTHPTGMLSYS